MDTVGAERKLLGLYFFANLFPLQNILVIEFRANIATLFALRLWGPPCEWCGLREQFQKRWRMRSYLM